MDTASSTYGEMAWISDRANKGHEGERLDDRPGTEIYLRDVGNQELTPLVQVRIESPTWNQVRIELRSLRNFQ